MDALELYQRIEKWEDIHTEFKENEIHPDRLASALVAFANTDGGQLIFGVNETRQISGVENTDRLIQRIEQVAYNNCEPPVTVIPEIVDADGKKVVVVNIPKGEQRPYRTNRGDYFIRTSSGKRRASRQELLRLFQASESLYYDETLVLRASLLDLDKGIFERFMQKVYQRSVEESGGFQNLLEKLRLARKHDEILYPTVTGLLFFGIEPQQFLPQAQIAAARIPGTDLSNPPSDAKQIGGPLLDMLEDTARFLNIHLQTSHRIQAYEPETFDEVPQSALRELLVNALAHRDYTVTAPVRVFIFDNRVEIRTPGSLPNTVTIDAIKMGAAHVLRNPNIYTFFSRWGLVTGIGTGVYRAIHSIREATGQEPDFSVVESEFVVSIPRRQGAL